jgi:hypothetical protein
MASQRACHENSPKLSSATPGEELHKMNTIISTPSLERSPIKYCNHFRWRVMPLDGAAAEGFYDRSFENKKKAVAYQ